MYQIGDIVVHPTHGAGCIDAVETQRIAGQSQTYYVFRIPSTSLVMHIPTANQNGLRPLIDAQQAQLLLEEFPQLQVQENRNWNKRYRENLDRLKSGRLEEVCLVLKSLMVREFQRGLSTGERKLLHTAKQIFISEVAVATGSDFLSVERAITKAIKESMVNQH